MRMPQWMIAFAIGLASPTLAPAQPSQPLVPAAAVEVITLASGVTISCDSSGSWSRIYVTEGEPSVTGDEQAVRAAQQAAEGRARTRVDAFFEQQSDAGALAGEIDKALWAAAERDGTKAVRLPPAAQQRLAAEILEARRARATGGFAFAPLLETGFDATRRMAWARVGVERKRAAPPAGARGGRGGAPASTVNGQAPIRLTGSIRPPTKIKDVRPTYPIDAQSKRIQGQVLIEATIGVDGSVTDARVVRSIPELDRAALDAVRQWRYTPTLIGGVPSPVIMTVTVSFTLQ